jgi:uncharacterized membrane protein YedE/YeeE
MDLKRLDRGEVLAILGGILLGISLTFAWYSLGNHYTHLNVCRGPHTDCTGWHSLEYIRWLIVLAALAPLILGYIVVRGSSLAWPRGELTAVVALGAIVLLVFRGVVDKPGYPTGEITVTWGWFLALLGGLLILLGAVTRTRESTTRRKPPGVL